MLAYFVDKLAKTEDGDGTLLDHSLLLYGSNMGNPNQHLHYDVPHVLIGGNHGAMKGGRHLAYPTKTVSTGNLLLSLLDQFDIRARQHRRQHGTTDEPMTRVPTHFGAVALALMLACASSAVAQTEVADAAMRRDSAEVRRLVQNGADVKAAQADGATALHWAAYHGDASLALLLLEAGADVAAANRNGSTPLWLAASQGDAPIIEALLKGGADANEPLPLGRRPLMLAARSGQSMRCARCWTAAPT